MYDDGSCKCDWRDEGDGDGDAWQDLAGVWFEPAVYANDSGQECDEAVCVAV